MKKLLAVLALAAGTLLVTGGPAAAAGQVCYDVYINASGQEPVAQRAVSRCRNRSPAKPKISGVPRLYLERLFGTIRTW